MSSNESILLEFNPPYATITLNLPHKKNALDIVGYKKLASMLNVSLWSAWAVCGGSEGSAGRTAASVGFMKQGGPCRILQTVQERGRYLSLLPVLDRRTPTLRSHSSALADPPSPRPSTSAPTFK